MKKLTKLTIILLVICLLATCVAGCEHYKPGPDPDPVEVDYAVAVAFDPTSTATVKQAVTVKTYIDGDTTHFYVPTSIAESGTLKARYLAINTPECSGKVEEYGKMAAKFTKEKLSSATSIYIESDDTSWNLDSTGYRHLVWVWYKTADSDVFRNLNIEILQNGLARASSSANNRYGTTCMSAIAQSKLFKYNLYSGLPDPNFYYGAAQELTLKELRCHVEDYVDTAVAFEGVVTRNSGSNGVYVESYDADTDMYYSMYIYYGFALSGDGLNILSVGNLVRIVGTVQYYEAGGTYQVSGLQYSPMRPTDPANIQKLGEGYSPAYDLITANQLKYGTVIITDENDIATTYDYGELALSSSVSLENLYVTSAYTTDNGESSSYGAITLTCRASDGTDITVRTTVMYDEYGNRVLQSAYEYKTINIKGFVDYYSGKYQIKVLDDVDITIVD
ncbi:MAG: thermonuclease family protein [Clostridia bacterium]|nr:thermonuclease family protein [Clostridia bacterium]